MADDARPPHCTTQEGEEPSFGAVPAALAGETGPNAPDDIPDLVVGYGEFVPRWYANTGRPTKVQYFVQRSGFPSAEKATLAATKFEEAARSWNGLDLGVIIVEVANKQEAHFDVVWEADPTYGDSVGSLAQAFFPHMRNTDVLVFDRALRPPYDAMLKGILQHEIGHILGLRHEFAITGSVEQKAEGFGAVQFDDRIQNSIMDYKFPPKVQPADVTQTRRFYQLPNGSQIKGRSVTDHYPIVKYRV